MKLITKAGTLAAARSSVKHLMTLGILSSSSSVQLVYHTIIQNVSRLSIEEGHQLVSVQAGLPEHQQEMEWLLCFFNDGWSIWESRRCQQR